MKLLPQTLPDDEDRELSAVLQELRYLMENINEFAPLRRISAVENVPEQWLQEKQGTLLWCRRLETAKKWLQQWPQAHFVSGKADDPRAYTAVGYGVESWGNRYTRIVLCDGLLCDGELTLLEKQYPGAAFCVLQSDGAAALLQKLHITKEALREIYKALRQFGGSDGAAFAEKMGMLPSRAKCAFEILCQMNLAQWSQDGSGICLLPARKCDPEESTLYRFLSSGTW